MKNTAPARPAPSQDEITLALKQAARQAHKQLVAQGQKLPTQTWTGSPVRNPAV